MKKIQILFVLVLSFMLVACSSNEKEEKNKDTVNVDKNLLTVEVTLPASFFEDTDMESLEKEAKKDGVKEVIINDDKSVTYKMTKSQHKKMMKEMEDTLVETIKETESDKEYPSIKTIEYNKAFTEYTITVDQKEYENSMDGFAIFGLAIQSMYYQLFEGVSEEDYKATFQLKDENTSKVFDTIVYPDDLETDETTETK